MRTLLAMIIACSVASGAFADPMAKITARQDFFKSLKDTLGPLKALTTNYDAAAAQDAAAKLQAALAVDVAPLFVSGTSEEDFPGKTGAKAKIWGNLDDFGAKGAAFQKAANHLIVVANSGDSDAFTPAFIQMGGTCKSCHDNYRSKR